MPNHHPVDAIVRARGCTRQPALALSSLLKPYTHSVPAHEAFLYFQEQRKTERFWTNLVRDLRETNSVYGAAIDDSPSSTRVTRPGEMKPAPTMSGYGDLV